MTGFRSILLGLVLLIFSGTGRALAQGGDAAETVDWLRSLIIESRATIDENAENPLPGIFVEELDDGRTWFDYIVDELVASGEWTLLDEAVSLCLAEAARLRGEAEEETDATREQLLREVRKLYLSAAARLLRDYGLASGQVFDTNAGPQLSLPELPDWTLPGEIQLHEIAGAGRINTETLAFSGRLSGLLELPGLETKLAVPNLSFDSRGNIDLLAYGSTMIPPEDPESFLLEIPKRRPLAVHLEETGEFSIAGGVRLKLADGNTFEGFFDVDDPEYAFGLAFSGSVTLELAKELTLLRPTFNVNAASEGALQLVGGFGQFFGSFGSGLEVFLDEAPEFPSLDEISIGAPPEFEAPETVVPFDVIEAWITAFANENIRPLVNSSIQQRNDALEKLREMFGELRSDLEAQRTDDPPKRAQLHRLKRVADINGRMVDLLNEEAARQEAGDDSGDLFAEVSDAADEALAVAEEYLQNTTADPNATNGSNFKAGFAAVRLYLETEATAEALGGSGTIDSSLINTKLDEWQGAALQRFGFRVNGTIENQATVDALSAEDFRVLSSVALELDALRETSGGMSNLLATIFLQLELEKVKALYNQAVAKKDIENRAVLAMRLLDLSIAEQNGLFTPGPADSALASRAWNDTIEHIASRGSGGAIGEKLAGQLMDAARRVNEDEEKKAIRRSRELLGETNEDRNTDPAAASTNPLKGEETFFQKAARFLGGNAPAEEKTRLQSNLAKYADAVADGNLEKFQQDADVENDMEGGLDFLKFGVDALAFIEEFLPGEAALLAEFQATWQAVHIKWTPIAEAQKLHWMLAAYTREISAAGERYADGVGTALESAFATAGVEAGQGLENVVAGMSVIVDAIGLEEFQIALPGDIEIRRLYGELAFNRIALSWDLKFGGKLLFPDINAVFEIPAAELMSSGEFEISMRAASDTAFGLNEDFSLELLIPAPGGTRFTGRLPFIIGFNPDNTPIFADARLDGFSGAGMLTQRVPGDTDQVYNVTVDYLALDPGHRFAVATSFTGQQEFFTEEILIFAGGFGFDLQTDLAGGIEQAGANVSTSLGLLIRPEAQNALDLPENDPGHKEIADLLPSDYFLKFDGAAKVEYFTDSDSGSPDFGQSVAEFTLESGTLLLPEDIFDGPGDGGAPSISLVDPVCVRINLENPASGIRWCDVNGNPVRLAINNLGFTIPGFEGSMTTSVATDETLAPEAASVPNFQANLSAILLLSGTNFPVIEKINAQVIFPFPGADPQDANNPNLVNLVIAGENWRIDGFPDEASVALGADLTLLDLDGLQVVIPANAGEEVAGCPGGLSFVRDSQTQETTIRVASSMRVTIDSEMIEAESATDQDGAPVAGGVLQTGVSGCFEWVIGDFPTFTLEDILFAGRFRLGGSDGIEIKGAGTNLLAMVLIENPAEIFNRTATNPNPFAVTFSGALKFADLAEFGVNDAKFIWDDSDIGAGGNPVPRNPSNNLIPRFSLGEVCLGVGADAIELANDLLPVYPTELCLAFLNPSAPLFPATGVTGLFDPANLRVTGSAVLALPTGSAIESGSPGITGSVDDLVITFDPDPGSGIPIPNFENINGFSLGLNNLDIPPLGGITGSIAVQNINDPPNLYFIGEVGGKVKDVGASVLLAAAPTELIGACFELDAGPAGIPIDGGTLGGILLTGGTGGINFKNSFSDPCDFEAYLAAGDLSAARGTNPPDFTDPDSGYEFPDGPTGDEMLSPQSLCVAPTQPEFNCIQGEFPPQSVNPLCEPIEINGETRIIFKGTNLPEFRPDPGQPPGFNLNPLDPDTPHNIGVNDVLMFAGVNPQQLDAMTPNEAIETFVTGITGQFEEAVEDFLGCIPEGNDDRAEAFYCQTIRELFNSMDDAAVAVLNEAFRVALDADPQASFYDILVAKAAEGIPCFDVTLKLGGTISHSTISTVLSGSGDVTISTTGTAVVEASINLVGIPVGNGTLAFALTDSTGTINPSFGGIIEAGVGPLELGKMTMSLSCQSLDGGSCYTAVQDALLNWIACNVQNFDAGVSTFMVQMMDEVAPRIDGNGNVMLRLLPGQMATATLLQNEFLLLTEGERFAWYSSFLNIFQIVANNTIKVAGGDTPDPLPVDLGANAEQILEGFLDCFKHLIVDVLSNVNPRICFSGDIGPKLFGFPLTGGAESLVAGGLLYERVIDEVAMEDYQQLVAQFEFSPSYMLLSPVGLSYAIPAFDTASMGFSMRVPAFDTTSVCTLLTDPVTFAADQLNVLVEDSVLTFGYQIEPLGYRLADGQGRVIFPRVGGHPCNPDRFKRNTLDPANPIDLPDPWVSPDVLALTDPSIPTRREVILAALSKGQLQNPLWRGSSQDLISLFSLPGSACYIPGNPGCLEFTQQVSERINAADPAFTLLQDMDFANDFFPHGGFIGGAEIALPNLFAQSPPVAQLAELVALPAGATPQEILDDFNNRWLPNAQLLFGDPADLANPDFGQPGYAYFTGTQCTGQMALYVPAANPPPAVFNGDFAQTLFDAISSVDFDSIIDGTAGLYGPDCPVYPAEEILLSGWMDVPILGLPVAQGLIDYNPSAGCFLLEAQVFGDYTRVIEPGDTAFLAGQLVNTSEFNSANNDATMAGLTPATGDQVTYTEVVDPGDTYFSAGQVVATTTFDRVNQETLDVDPMSQIATGLVVPKNWLNELIGVSMQVEIKAPDYLDPATFDPDVPVMSGSNERLVAMGENLPANDTGVDAFLTDIFRDMPKASVLVDSRLAIPSEFDDFLRIPGDVEGNINSQFFAFSPFFEPDFNPTDQSPFAVARRRGGIGVNAGFEFGFFPDGTNVAEQLVFEVGAEASLALTPDADLGVFPALSGQIEAFATLPGVFSFDGSTPDPYMFDGLLRFNSSPEIGEDWVFVEGMLSPIDLGPFLQVTPLPADANPDDKLGGSIAVTREAGGPSVGLSLNAAAMNIPMLGTVTGRIYGEKIPVIANPDVCNPDHFDFTPFTFSTSPGEPWNATIDICGALQVRSPFDPTGPVLFEAQPLTSGGQPIPFVCEIDGVGLESFDLKLQVPTGITFTLFPGTPQQSQFNVGGNAAACLLITSEGRVYFDSGTQSLDLALPALVGGEIDPSGLPLAQITGRIELGFEPVDATPGISVTPTSASLNTSLGSSTTSLVTVTNTNPDGSLLEVDADLTDSTHFEITPSRLLLGGGESGTITVRFTPRDGGSKSSDLTLAHNASGPGLVVPLTGTVSTFPRLRINATSVDFGATPVASSKSQAVVVTNTGSGSLTLSGISTTGPFSDNRSSLIVSPGENRTIIVTFEPTTSGSASGTLTMNTTDPSNSTVTVNLTGNGNNRFWYRQRKGAGYTSLLDVSFVGETGITAGLRGAYFNGTVFGKTWERAAQPGDRQFSSVVHIDADNAWMFGVETQSGTFGRGLGVKTTDGGDTWTVMTDNDVDNSSRFWNAATERPGTGNVFAAGGFFTLSGSPNLQARIIEQTGPTSFETKPISPSGLPPLNGIAFSPGSNLFGLAVGDNQTVVRTEDGGKTWNQLTTLPNVGGAKLNDVAGNPFSTANFIIVGEGGLILRTTDFGNTWTTRTSNTTEDLYAVVRGASNFYAVGDNGTVLQGSFTGFNAWIVEDARTEDDLRGVTVASEGSTSAGAEAWAVSEDGTILHRLASPISGPIAVVNVEDPLDERESRGIGERVIREVRYSNEGTSDLTVQMVASGGNATSFEVREDPFYDTDTKNPGSPVQIPPGCEGIFYVITEQTNSGLIGTELDVTSNDNSIDKFDPTVTTNSRVGNFTELGYLQAPTCLDLGQVIVGDTVSDSILLENIGEAKLNLHGSEVRHDHENALFDTRFGLGGGDVSPKGSEAVIVSFTATEPGIYRGIAEIFSDARNGVVRVEVVAEAVAQPETILFTTDVFGALFQIDHDDNGTLSNFSTPVVFTVVDGTPTSSLELQRGRVIDVMANASFVRSGVTYDFLRWEPGTEAAFQFTVGDGVEHFHARYASSRPAGPTVPTPPVLSGVDCDFGRAQQDVAFGPWVRVTEARLSLPWLGDGGEDFAVEGALFISLQKACGSLTSSSVRAVVPPDSAIAPNLEILEITPGAWSFDIRSTGEAEFHSLTPGVQIFDVSALPPTALDIEIDLNASDFERRAFIRFATLDDLHLIPGILALGPSGAELEASLVPNELAFHFGLDGSIQMLANPLDGGTWMIDQPFDLEFDTVIGIEPLTFQDSRQLADVGLFRLHSRAGLTTIGPEFDGVTFTLAARQFEIDVLRSPERINLNEISVDSMGTFTFDAALPSTGITTGPVKIEPQSTAGNNENATVVANPFQALLQVQIPGFHVNSTSGRWPDDQIAFDPIEFDSTNFAVRTELPSLSFGNSPTDTHFNLGGSDLDADNYFEFRRSGNSTSMRLRNRQDIFIGGFKFKLDIDSTNGVEGLLAGRIGLEGPTPLDLVQDYTSMAYRSNPPTDRANFELNRFFFGIACRLQVGSISPVVQACLLLDRSPDPIEDWPCL
ncbi:MAG: choice-of-anchor D domain-containing protein [Verrucomicrobiota bacterium]